MARSFSTATLTVKIQEGIVLGGQNMGALNSFSVTGIKNVVKRLMTATLSLVEILSFGAAEGKGQYIAANVRYIRITNLDDTNHVALTFKSTASNDEICVKLDKGQSFIYNADTSGGLIDTMTGTDGGTAVAAALEDLSNVYVLADTASCDIEVYIATT